MEISLNAAKEKLISMGFKISPQVVPANGNLAPWQATRRSSIAARECEKNGDRCILVVTPYAIDVGEGVYESAEVSLTGEVNGIWWCLKAYSLSIDKLSERLDEIEAHLVRSWNAL